MFKILFQDFTFKMRITEYFENSIEKLTTQDYGKTNPEKKGSRFKSLFHYMKFRTHLIF